MSTSWSFLTTMGKLHTIRPSFASNEEEAKYYIEEATYALLKPKKDKALELLELGINAFLKQDQVSIEV